MRMLQLNRLSAMNCRFMSLLSKPGMFDNLLPTCAVRTMSSGSSQLPGNWGSDSLKGSTIRSGGTIRESGGAFGEREHALEELYFRNVTSHQLENLREHHFDEIKHLEKTLKTSEESLKRHKMRLDILKKFSSQLE